MTTQIQFTKADVEIEEYLVRRCNECGDDTSGPVATCVIMLDFRAAGTTVQYGEGAYCSSCAREIAQRLRASLPEYVEEPDESGIPY